MREEKLALVDDSQNPLDSVEEILVSHNWVFSRLNDDELSVRVTGKSCDYDLDFIWQEDLSALQFSITYNLSIPDDKKLQIAQTLLTINQNLWMGHFGLTKEDLSPCFRQTCMMRGIVNKSFSEHIEDLVDISLAQCERYYPAFDLLANTHAANDQHISLALMDTMGES